MEDLAQQISQHSHYEPDADLINDRFWEDLYERYGAEYLATAGRHSLSDFQVWAEDRGLVPDYV